LAELTRHYFNIGAAATQAGSLTIPANEFRALYRGPDDPSPLPAHQRNPRSPFNRNSTLGELRSTNIGRAVFAAVSKQMSGTDEPGAIMDPKAVEHMVSEMPLRALVMMSDGALNWPMAGIILALANRKPIRAAEWVPALLRMLRGKDL
jgi:hypothetical protein